jgi:hypothetical protein
MNCVGASLLALLTCLGNPDPNVSSRISSDPFRDGVDERRHGDQTAARAHP